MCAFSQPVDVSDTLIFARIEGPRQYLVYKMVFSSDEDLAMILPIPVSTGSGEDAVSFISMEDHPDFFNMLSVLFPTLEEEDEAEMYLLKTRWQKRSSMFIRWAISMPHLYRISRTFRAWMKGSACPGTCLNNFPAARTTDS